VLGSVQPPVYQDVRRRDVPVHQSCPMRRVKRGSDRRQELRCPSRGQRPFTVEDLPQVAAGYQPHRDEQRVPGLAGLVDRDDVRVIDSGRGPRLGDEPQPELLVGGQRRGEHLQRDHPAKPLVAGPVDNGHAARAERLFHPVPGHKRPRRGLARQQQLLAQPSHPAPFHRTPWQPYRA